MTGPVPKRETLSREAILDSAEDVLRRFGPSKATVVDVAKALGVSHGSVYRHFESKAALRDAVTKRWLERVLQPLAAIADGKGAPVKRLRRWLDALIAAKRQRLFDDRELFATYVALTVEAREVVHEHVQELVGQVAQIMEAGMASGDFTITNASASARALLAATGRYHDPTHAAEWKVEGVDRVYEDIWELALRGLTAPK